MPGLPAAGRVARAGGPREAQGLRRRDLLGPADPGWGAEQPAVLIVGLAPAAHGGNRTGRIFTGDRSGDWLFASLHRVGLAVQQTSTHVGDGQALIGTRMLAAVRCAPPDNKPTPAERDTCAPWMVREVELVLPGLRVAVALGAFAWQSLLSTLQQLGLPVPRPRPRFGHGAEVRIGPLVVLGSFHPSQQNTFTGRLTAPMLDQVLGRSADLARHRGGERFYALTMVNTAASPERTRILVVGGGYVGMYTALRLQKRLKKELKAKTVEVIVVDPRSYMTYQPFLPEAAAGNVEPRHVVVPLRRVLDKCEVLTGRVDSVDHGRKVARIHPVRGEAYDLSYEVVVLAPGSIARTLPIPGLAELGIGFKQVEEAIALRNTMLEKLDIATSVTDHAARRALLTFVFVGGGYAGIEALGELEDMTTYATRYYPDLSKGDIRFVLVEASDRILPEVGEDLGRYTVEQLRQRKIDVRLETRLESCVGGHIVLSDGEEFDAETVVWTAGVKANPMLAATGLPVDDKGRLRCHADLRVENVADAWSAGDGAAVPDLTGPPGAICSPSAQHAVRQAKKLGDNIALVLRGRTPDSYAHEHVGSVASLGMYKGVAEVYGVKLRGWPAWFMHRTYHVSRLPTLNRKIRVVLDWTLALFFRRDVVSLGSLQRPREEFSEASR